MSSSRPPLPGVRRAELRGLELDHCLARGLLVGCGVDRFQRGGNLSAVLVGHEPRRSPGQVDYAGLDHRVRPGRLGQAGEPVAAHDQHVPHPAVGQVGADMSPNADPSVSWTQISSTRLTPSRSTPTAIWAARLMTWLFWRILIRIASR